jgi:hypothetical protein
MPDSALVKQHFGAVVGRDHHVIVFYVIPSQLLGFGLAVFTDLQVN